jgi:hypothetical protein
LSSVVKSGYSNFPVAVFTLAVLSRILVTDPQWMIAVRTIHLNHSKPFPFPTRLTLKVTLRFAINKCRVRQ